MTLPHRIEAAEGADIERLKADTIKGPTILLYSGNYFSFERPQDCHWELEDIAHGLAMTCRFAGQARRYYSVAEHSVYVSQLVPPELAWDALMHDAAEAFICDMAKPLKVMLPDYKVVEQRVEKAIAERYRLIDPMPREIKLADIQMLRAEQVQIMRNNDDWEWTFDVPEPDIRIAALGPYEAKALFLDRAAALRAKESSDGE